MRTDSRMRQQYAKNLEQMRGMLEKARKVAPKKVGGYTVAQLEGHVARFEEIVAMDDETLQAHLSTMLGTKVMCTDPERYKEHELGTSMADCHTCAMQQERE
jgi:hypothetical protein